VLLDIAGQPMLAWVVARARLAKALDEVLVATTNEPADDPVAEVCAQRNYPCYRGSLHDVLDRYYQAASLCGAQVIVRITADCPLIDPELIDQALTEFGTQRWDMVANRLPPPWGRSYPIGLDLEICSFTTLARAWREANQTYQREHVMPYLYDDAVRIPENQAPSKPPLAVAYQGRFRVLLLHHDPDYGSLRWTVDTAADLELVRAIAGRFPGRIDFSWLEVLQLFEREPHLAAINASVQHKTLTDIDERT
jgi:spore coat polysaccharide biosynthesis protein SpsF